MTAPVDWTPEMDTLLLRMREHGHSWARIGQALGLGHGVVRRRARALALSTERISSGPMSGTAIASGKRPLARRFCVPSDRKRLGRVRASETVVLILQWTHR